MKSLLVITLLALNISAAQSQDTSRTRLVGFPITDYMITGDTAQIVQVLLPNGITMNMKQLGLLKGIYRNGKADTATIGHGRCQLIKGQYYYFGILSDKGARLPLKGDLIYTWMPKNNTYNGRYTKLSAHAITLLSVYGDTLYRPLSLLMKWTAADESALNDSIISDIHFTGNFMKEQSPSANAKVESGKYKDRMIFDVMKEMKKEDLLDFLDYVAARPSMYAGNAWKSSEVFATWVVAGAPTVMR